ARRRRERELRIYRDLIGGTEAQAQLGTPRYYGSVWDDKAGRYWLLLEYVDGTEVGYCDFTYWVGAARWLGRMQGYFAQQAEQLRDCDYLIRHDEDFFLSHFELAVRTLSHIPASLAQRLAGIL